MMFNIGMVKICTRALVRGFITQIQKLTCLQLSEAGFMTWHIRYSCILYISGPTPEKHSFLEELCQHLELIKTHQCALISL